ncbi:hypothetical protein GCM10018952_40030 [Streptosporangium vulgare]
MGATTSTDARASYSNFGTCLDLFAPGSAITSAWNTNDTASNTINGTSMASPHVAGAAALILSGTPGATPAQVRDTIVANATPGVVTSPGTGSPNLLLYVGGGGPGPQPTVVYSDDFEAERGWTTNPGGTDTATTGRFERGDPGQTSSGVITQPGTTPSGTYGLVSGAAAGSSAGDGDIDGGVTSAQSPAITLPASGTLTLSFSWYLGHLNNASSADYVRVRVVGTTTTTVLNQTGAASNRAATWATANGQHLRPRRTGRPRRRGRGRRLRGEPGGGRDRRRQDHLTVDLPGSTRHPRLAIGPPFPPGVARSFSPEVTRILPRR